MRGRGRGRARKQEENKETRREGRKVWVKQDGNMVNMEESKRGRERRDKEPWVRKLGTGQVVVVCDGGRMPP